MRWWGRSLLGIALAGAALLLVQGATQVHAAGTEEQAPAPAKEAVADASLLRGTWQRSDGGYLLVIEELGEDGRMRASYYNPNPVHVAEARFSRVEGQLRVFVELRDTNYPGSRYELVYDPTQDRLAGSYYQAMARETYEVHFVRVQR